MTHRGRRCAYCGTPMRKRGERNSKGQIFPNSVTTDHVIPRAKFEAGNYDFPAHLETANVCQCCNGMKGDMWPLDWLRVMPAYGVMAFCSRLLAMGCEPADVSQARAERKRPMLATQNNLTSGT